MRNNYVSMPFAAKLLSVLHFILGIGALGGGAVLIIDPSGEIMHMPSTILTGSPFKDFLIPGIILFAILGVCPLIIAVSLIKQWQWKAADRLNLFSGFHWSWAYSLYIGFALIIWISLEVFFIQQMALIHLIYIFLGLALQAITLLPSVQGYCRR